MAKIDNPSTFSLKARLQFPTGVALPPKKKTSLWVGPVSMCQLN